MALEPAPPPPHLLCRQRQRRLPLALAVLAAVVAAGAAVVAVYGGGRQQHAGHQPGPSPATATVETTGVSSFPADPYTALSEANLHNTRSVGDDARGSGGGDGNKAPSPSSSSSQESWISRISSGLTGGSRGGGSVIKDAQEQMKQVAADTLALPVTSTACTAQNGGDVVAMLSPTSACTLVMLVPEVDSFDITSMINVSTTKVLMGNPINLPEIHAVGIERLFDILDGGRLDVRFVRLFKGMGVYNAEEQLDVAVGPTARVKLGGYFSAEGCYFQHPPQTFENWLMLLNVALTLRRRTYGGHIYVEGGQVILTGCIFVNYYPYGVPLVNNVIIGGQVLVIAGNAVIFGTEVLGAALGGMAVVVGAVVAVLGGTCTWVGGGLTGVIPITAQGTAGVDIFVGAGVMISVGFRYINTVLTLFRAGFGEFTVGEGVMLRIGIVHTRVWGVGSVWGAGNTYAVGSGLLRTVGMGAATSAIAQCFFGAGGNTFVGSGNLAWLGVARSFGGIATSNNGVGLTTFTSRGVMNKNWCPTASAVVVRYTSGVSENFIGYGWLNMFGSSRAGYSAASVNHGVGLNTYVAGGGAAFYRNSATGAAVFNHEVAEGTFTVGGTGIADPAAGRSFTIVGGKINFYDRKRRGLLAGPLPRYESRAISIENEERSLIIDPAKLAATTTDLPRDATWQDAMSRIDEASTDTSTTRPWTMSANGTVQCYMCGAKPAGVSHYEGPDTCEEHETCPAGALAEQLALGNRSLPTGTEIPDNDRRRRLTKRGRGRRALEEDSRDMLPDTTILWVELVAYCQGGGTSESLCMTRGEVKEVLLAYLSLPPACTLTVFGAGGVHPAVAKLVSDDLLSALAPPGHADPACSVASKFSVIVTTDGKQAAELPQKRIDAVVKDPTGLREAMQKAHQADDVKLCELTVKQVVSTTYPPLERAPNYNPCTLGSIGPAVLLGSDRSIAPLKEVVIGHEYKTHVVKFLRGTRVTVALLKAGGVGDKKAETTTTILGTIESFGDGSNSCSSSSLDFTAPSEPGLYYLHAYDQDRDKVFFAFSQAFTAVAEPTYPARRW